MAERVRAIAGRIEAGLEKIYAYESARHNEDARKNQELKTALLDSLVHEIKTPLSMIKTAVTSLLSRDSDAAKRLDARLLRNGPNRSDTRQVVRLPLPPTCRAVLSRIAIFLKDGRR